MYIHIMYYYIICYYPPEIHDPGAGLGTPCSERDKWGQH